MPNILKAGLVGLGLFQVGQAIENVSVVNKTSPFIFPPVDQASPTNSSLGCTDPATTDYCVHEWISDPDNNCPTPNEECITECFTALGCCEDGSTETKFNDCPPDSGDDLAKKFFISEGVIAGAGLLGVLYNWRKQRPNFQPNESKVSISCIMAGALGILATALGKIYPNFGIVTGSTLSMGFGFFTTYTCLKKAAVNNNPLQQPLNADHGDNNGVNHDMA